VLGQVRAEGRAEGREQGRVEGREEGLAAGLAEGMRAGLAEGREAREQMRREMTAWYGRLEAARREGTPFDEPPPYTDANGRSGNGQSA